MKFFTAIASPITSFWGWLFRTVRKPQTVAVPPSVVVAVPNSPPPKASRRQKPNTDGQKSFVYLGDILEQIPACRRLLRKMRAIDKDAYDYHSRVGARLIPSDSTAWFGEIGQQFSKILPAAAMVYLPSGTGEHSGLFIYVQKLISGSRHIVVPMGARAVYRASIACSQPNIKSVLGYSFTVAIMEGGAKVVSERTLEKCFLPRGGHFTRILWGISPQLLWHWNSKRSSDVGMDAKTPEEFGASMFCLATGFMEQEKEFHVRCERDNVSVGFGIALGRTPYFFKDRDAVVSERGKKRRIFHAVEAHTRVLADGKKVDVVGHYRGLRRFTWNGELVTITKPDNSALGWDGAAIEVPFDQVSPRKMISLSQAADVVVRVTER